MEPRVLDLDKRRAAPKPFPSELLLSREERARRRPRDPDEDRALTCIVAAKAELYRASGKVEFVNDRERRFFVGRDRIIEYLQKAGLKGEE